MNLERIDVFEVVWSLLLQADFEGPSPISCATSWRTFKSSIWGDSWGQRLRVEITHSNSINENHIERFCAVWKQRIDSSYSHSLTALFIRSGYP
jgi:hypothetical protein